MERQRYETFLFLVKILVFIQLILSVASTVELNKGLNGEAVVKSNSDITHLKDRMSSIEAKIQHQEKKANLFENTSIEDKKTINQLIARVS